MAIKRLQLTRTLFGPQGPKGPKGDAGSSVPPTLPITAARVSGAAIDAGALVKPDATTEGRVVMLAAGDDVSLCTGVALTSAAGAGLPVTVVELHGQVVTLISDGSDTFAPRDAVGASPTVAGRVVKIGAGNMMGRAVNTVAASLGASVDVYFSPGSIT